MYCIVLYFITRKKIIYDRKQKDMIEQITNVKLPFQTFQPPHTTPEKKAVAIVVNCFHLEIVLRFALSVSGKKNLKPFV